MDNGSINEGLHILKYICKLPSHTIKNRNESLDMRKIGIVA